MPVFRTWIDREGIGGGQQWRQTIVTAIQSSECVLLLLSPNSVSSRNVRKELDLADSANRKILPLEIMATPIPDDMKFQLAGIQKIELWRNPALGYNQLLETLVRFRIQRSQPDRGSSRTARSSSRSSVDLSELGGGKLLDRLSLRNLFGRKRKKMMAARTTFFDRINGRPGFKMLAIVLGCMLASLGGCASDNVEQSVVRILLQGPGKLLSGTGFVVAKGGYVATNYHIVKPAKKQPGLAHQRLSRRRKIERIYGPCQMDISRA